MVVVAGVGVEARRPGAEVDRLDLAHGGQVVERLVDGTERDGGHLTAYRLVDRFGGRMRGRAVEHAEDRLALRGDLEPLRPEDLGELLG